jgi:hypothetical protein
VLALALALALALLWRGAAPAGWFPAGWLLLASPSRAALLRLLSELAPNLARVR